MFKKLCISASITASVFAFGNCADNSQPTTNAVVRANSNPAANLNVSANANANAAVNSATTNAANAASNSAATSTNANSVSVGEVTRISFAKGATSGTQSVTLAPNAAKQFAVEADYGQKIKVTTDSKSATVKMLSGTDRQTESAGGGLILQVQTSGDVIFEVKNTTAQELKTTVRAEVTKGY